VAAVLFAVVAFSPLSRSAGAGEASFMATALAAGAIWLPFALAFVAIPLESFVSSSRTVLGIVVAGALRLLAFILRLIGNLGYYTGRLVINLYDLIIFPSIWLEGVLTGSKGKRREPAEEQLFEDNGITEEAVDSLNDTIEYKEPQE
jgi:hypothetical protein